MTNENDRMQVSRRQFVAGSLALALCAGASFASVARADDPCLIDINADADVEASLEDFLTPEELASLDTVAYSGDGTVTFAQLISYAAQYLGYDYVWGSTTPENGGFDCSGFIAWVYDNVAGTSMRDGGVTARGIYNNRCEAVDRDNAMPGDLVFFTGTYTPSGWTDEESLTFISHVGIYLGDGMMIHSGTNGVSYAKVDWIRNQFGDIATQYYGRLWGVEVTRESQSWYRFYDVPADAWYVGGGWLDYVVDAGVMRGGTQSDGSSNGLFMPEESLTRGQVATILYRFANPGYTDTTDPNNYGSATHFYDVNPYCYYTASIEWCYNHGIITGYEEGGEPTGFFGPEDAVTREQLATMAARFANMYGVNVGDCSVTVVDEMPDGAEVDLYARESLAWCMQAGIMTGDIDANGTAWLRPANNATRAQMAKVATKLFRDAIGG